jgi:RNA polymerase sigma factor (sigma-70 family)
MIGTAVQMRTVQTRTVVVDDHDVARLGLVAILESIPGVLVVAEASDAPGAIDAVRSYEPDLVLLDVRMPDTEGLDAARQIRALRPRTRVVMVSYWDVPEYRVEALDAGANGYISKGARRKEIVDEIDRVLREVPPRLPRLDQPGVAAESGYAPVNAQTAIACLTPRQRQVLELIAVGLRNREIGEQLGITTKTVKKLVEQILAQLQVPNRTQAALVWVQSARSASLPPGTRSA